LWLFSDIEVLTHEPPSLKEQLKSAPNPPAPTKARVPNRQFYFMDPRYSPMRLLLYVEAIAGAGWTCSVWRASAILRVVVAKWARGTLAGGVSGTVRLQKPARGVPARLVRGAPPGMAPQGGVVLICCDYRLPAGRSPAALGGVASTSTCLYKCTPRYYAVE
jgi:hypothetical protein